LRVIDRLLEFLKQQNLSPYTFERTCGIANGYLKKQEKGKGSIGSEILEKIILRYQHLSVHWLVTGRGSMLRNGTYGVAGDAGSLLEEESPYASPEETIRALKEKVAILENSIADKDKIIRLLEKSAQ